MSDDELLYSEEDEDQSQPPIFLNSRAGRCLTDVVNEMFMEGSLNLTQLEDIPNRFSDCMRRVISEKSEVKIKLSAQLKEFRDVPAGAVWHCNGGKANLPYLEISGNFFQVKASF